MDVTLVGAELEENLAIRYLASALESAGHSAGLLTLSDPSDTTAVVEQVMRTGPALVGMSVAFQRRAHEFGRLAEALRQAGYRGHITCGGHFPTFAWREYLERYRSIDSVVRHEGEHTLPALCDALAGHEPLANLDGIAYRTSDGAIVATRPRALVAELDSIAFPKRVGQPQVHLGIPAAFVIGSRGCYGHCTFCCIHAYVRDAGGPKYRARSADNIADELAELRASRGARMFVFHDDDFFTRDHARDLARVTALRDALVQRGVRDIALVVKARPDDLDEQVFRVLEQIGLLRVYVGIEAGCTQGLRTLGRGVDMAANHRALRFLRERDVYACFNMLIFDPDNTIPSLRESLSFLRDNADVPMNFCRTEVYVGTPLMTRLAREGRLRGDVFGWDYEIGDAAAERAFRVFSHAFYDRNFRCNGLMNSNLGLGYHLHLLRHFYPHAVTADLRRHTEAVIRRVNLDCVERMSRIVDFAETPLSAERAAFQDFQGEQTRSTLEANRLLEEQVAEVTRWIVRAARGQQVKAIPMWVSVAAATLALSPLACDPLMPPPPDPLPPPREQPYDKNTVLVPADQDGGSRFAQPPPDEYVAPDPLPMPPDPLPPPNDQIPPPPDPPPPPHYTP